MIRGSLGQFSTGSDQSLQRYDARGHGNEGHVDGRANHVLASVLLARDKQEDTGNEVEEEGRRERKPELVESSDERL